MLTALLVGFLLVTKHIVIANIIDFGYSQSRDTRNRYWWAAFLMWGTTELVASKTIIPHSTEWLLDNFLLLEMLLLCGSTFFERRSIIGQELRTHFLWEIFILCLYGLTVLAIAT